MGSNALIVGARNGTFLLAFFVLSYQLCLFYRTYMGNADFNTTTYVSQPLMRRPFTNKEMIDAVRRMANKLNKDIVSQCDVRAFGSGWGAHTLCNVRPGPPTCFFYSFGISHDYSFDVDLANEWGCQGFAADPTIVHPSRLHPNVSFHNIGAKMRGPNSLPLATSMPSLRRWLGHERVAVLKMDCEGCEYSLGEDIASENPDFFSHVDQFAVEVHVSRRWLNSTDTLHALGLLYLFLEGAGHELQHAEVTACASEDEAMGCLPALHEMNYPCGIQKSCHIYLFAKM